MAAFLLIISNKMGQFQIFSYYLVLNIGLEKIKLN